MNEFLVIISIIIAVTIGYFVIKGFNLLVFHSFLEILAYSYGLGIVFIAYQMFIYSWIGFAWSINSIILPWIIFFFIIFILRKKYFLLKINYLFRLSYIEKIFFVLIGALIIFVALESLIRPLSAWDGFAIWLLRAKVFFFDGKIGDYIFEYSESDYPVGISLFATFSYIILGTVDDRAVLLIFFMFYLVLSVVFFFSLRRHTSSLNAFVFTFLLASIQNLIRQGGRYDVGHIDLALGYYFFMIVMLLIDFFNKRSLKILILLNIFLGFAPFIKNEGLIFSIIIEVFIVYALIKYKKIDYIFYTLFFLFPVLMWQLFKMYLPVPHGYLEKGSLHISRIFVIYKEILKEFLNIYRWNLLWPIFFISLIISKIKGHFNLVIVIIFFQMVAYLFVYLYTPLDPVLHVKSSFDRLLIHLSPLSIFFVGLVFHSCSHRFNKKKNLI